MTRVPGLVVFSDLDGTLLDHGNYDWSAAKPALTALAKRNFPVILTSSKTAAEIRKLQQQMGLSGLPAIVENGAGVIGLEQEQTTGLSEYARIRESLAMLPRTLRSKFKGFGDVSLSEIQLLTGLPEDAAQLAQCREFTEPGLWSGSLDEKDVFARALREAGLSLQQGGRFLTVSCGRTKADGMAHVMQQFAGAKSVALGDAPNDIEMLEAADFGVIVANPHREPLPKLQGETDGRISRTEAAGPEGWNIAVLELLNREEFRIGTRTHG